MEIWVDKEIGVNYVFYYYGYVVGFMFLFDWEGKFVIFLIVSK